MLNLTQSHYIDIQFYEHINIIILKRHLIIYHNN